MENKWKIDMEGKKLAYVDVYEQLYKMITDGTFPVGSKLPSEPKLAESLGVSRMTLRKALGLLHDDALIKKVQGAGTFVMAGNRMSEGNLERFGMPVYNCCKDKIVRMEMSFRLEVPTPYLTEVLKRKSAVVISVDRYYYSESELIAFTYTTIPVETVSEMGIDLNDKEALKDFVETGIYERGKHSVLELLPDSEGVAIVEDKMKKGAHITLLMENIYGEDIFPLLCNKHYFLTEEASFVFNVYNERT